MKQRTIADVVRAQDPAATEAGQHLLSLSPDTHIDSLEVFEEAILVEDSDFSGPVLWHVTLNFPDAARGPIVASESLPGVFRGRYEGNQPRVETLDVDVSSLSEPTSQEQPG